MRYIIFRDGAMGKQYIKDADNKLEFTLHREEAMIYSMREASVYATKLNNTSFDLYGLEAIEWMDRRDLDNVRKKAQKL